MYNIKNKRYDTTTNMKELKRIMNEYDMQPYIAREFQRNIYFCFIDYAKAFDCVDSQRTVENSETDRHTRPPDLPPEKSVCRSRSNS